MGNPELHIAQEDIIDICKDCKVTVEKAGLAVFPIPEDELFDYETTKVLKVS